MTALLTQAQKQAVTLNTGGAFSLGDTNGDGFEDIGAYVRAGDPVLLEFEGQTVQRGVGQVFFGAQQRSTFAALGPDLLLEPEISDSNLFHDTNRFNNFRSLKFAALGDLNGDLKTDFALADGNTGGALHIYLGRKPGPVTPATPAGPAAAKPPREEFAFTLAIPLPLRIEMNPPPFVLPVFLSIPLPR
jgi:hypothetical protein